jgi:hypothetical protein
MNKYIFFFLIVVVMQSCSGPSGGFAPGGSSELPASPATGYQMNYKNGINATTSSGWNITMDTTDPIQNKAANGGWTVEVKYE